jgi:hypothetical protein
VFKLEASKTAHDPFTLLNSTIMTHSLHAKR